MKIFSLVGLLVSVSIAGCASRGDSTEVVTPSELLARAKDFNGDFVVVYGWMESGFERYRIWDDRSASDGRHYVDGCIALAIPVDMESDSFDATEVTIKGTFVATVDPNELISGGCRNRATVYVQKIQSGPR